MGRATFGLQPTYKTHLTSAGEQTVGALCRSEQSRPRSSGETVTAGEQRDMWRRQLRCLKTLSLPRHPCGDSKPRDKIGVCADILVFYIPFFFHLSYVLFFTWKLEQACSSALSTLTVTVPTSISLESSARQDMLTKDIHHGSGSPSWVRLDM